MRNSFSEHNDETKQNYQKQLEDAERNIEILKRDNEEYFKKIWVIFEWQRSQNREDMRNKEGNINESTYTDSLNSAASLYNELNHHKAKLKKDLTKYEQSIKDQAKRKKEVYDIMTNYKRELLNNAEFKKGGRISEETIEQWMRDEKEREDSIRDLRIANIKGTLELNRYKKQLKKMEEYFEGLHTIDFEQLKIENNVAN